MLKLMSDVGGDAVEGETPVFTMEIAEGEKLKFRQRVTYIYT